MGLLHDRRDPVHDIGMITRHIPDFSEIGRQVVEFDGPVRVLFDSGKNSVKPLKTKDLRLKWNVVLRQHGRRIVSAFVCTFLGTA